MTSIGVIGLGHWGSKVVEEYTHLRNEGRIEEVAACDLDDSRLDAVQGADYCLSDLDSTLRKVDGIHVCTPNETHVPIGMEAVRSGVDIMIEKPITTDRNAAFDLMEIANEENQIIQTGHIYRFANVIQTVRDLYRDGRFGTLNDVTLRWTHHIEPPSGTDVLWDLAPHPIDILNFVTDDWPSKEQCQTRTIPGVDGAVSATAQFSVAGAEVTMQVSWDDYIRRRTIELAGTEASAKIDAVSQDIEIYDESGVSKYPVEKNNTIRAEASNFIDAIETGHNTINSAVVGVRTVEAIERLQEVRQK
ncbi:Gfo/Idh/MocA family protein [Halopiger aswanensis]|uniref:Putative dehydrogenase n=1 Tax=Halopiger aswanensis TaxID=148449 RepID=A0A3R7GYL2_9EURY|nr:Gfo/Idh/MocA family oxidoreductase [Halopiger aswanensis]RKD98051.1 putative dehydrogenase [Halopiger aswanensis]